MTEYDPDPDTGLRGDLPLSEHVEQVGYTPTELRNPGVYTLRCCRPDDPTAAWDEIFDHRSQYVDEMIDASEIVYVGAAKDVYDRLTDHVAGDVRQTALLRVCPPHNLIDVQLFDSADKAFMRESGIATQLQNQNPSWYVHSR